MNIVLYLTLGDLIAKGWYLQACRSKLSSRTSFFISLFLKSSLELSTCHVTGVTEWQECENIPGHVTHMWPTCQEGGTIPHCSNHCNLMVKLWNRTLVRELVNLTILACQSSPGVPGKLVFGPWLAIRWFGRISIFVVGCDDLDLFLLDASFENCICR